MRYLIINADDFGYSQGINRGIIEAHQKGVVTSTSVMVDEVAAYEAARLRDYPQLSVGLHLVLQENTEETVRAELARQVARFTEIIGHAPDHIDTHKQRPDADENVKKVLLAHAKQHHVPVRSLCQAKFVETFIGFNADGSVDVGNVSVERLKAAIDQATDDYNELMCHVGYTDEHLRQVSSYNDVREAELRSLTDPAVLPYIRTSGLTLVNWSVLASREK